MKVSSLQKGFSLAEVVIALAIAALGFVSLLGLLPQGLQMSRQAANLAAESRIIDQITSELNSTPWDKINWTSGFGSNRLFNDQGVELSETDLSDPEMAFTLSYVVSVYVPSVSEEGPLKVQLPMKNVTGAQLIPEDLVRRVRIHIASSTNKNFNFNSAASNTYSYRSILLVKSGSETTPP